MSIKRLPLLLLIFLCSVAYAQIQGEAPALTPFASEAGTYLIAMPSYTYSRAPGALGLNAEEETWRPDKWRNRQVFGRFVPIMDLETRQSSIWFYTGNEIGDMLWQELQTKGEEPNRTPMLYGGFATKPFLGGFYGMAEFNQIDHFSEATFEARKKRIDSQKFSWFGENLPAYSGVSGGFGYNGAGDFFKGASVLAGSEYLWAWNEEQWVPIRISPRVEGNANFYFMETEIELNTSSEKFQIQDSAAQTRSGFGLRLKGENSGGGLYASRAGDEEHLATWTQFNHSFFGFANRGFVVLSTEQSQIMGKSVLDLDKPVFFAFADSLEYAAKISNPTDLIFGVLFNQNGAKLYGETIYKSQPIFLRTKAYQNYTPDFESVGFDSEIAYKSRLAEAGAVYSREFFEYYRGMLFYDVKPAESSAKFFLKYRFLEDLSFTHEWVYRGQVSGVPASWIWNMQVEQRIPKLNASLYAVLLNAVSKDSKDFSFGGINSARFYCGVNMEL
ncbi:MAG: hypothetical protein LBH25_11700 [Fibromonadaceae bacterium]|jgi:hypothetical protein|nr:hypothetical protein [Fibromonadaceae bacterium]